MAIRVALIGTGNCGSLALRQLIEDTRFDLTGVWVVVGRQGRQGRGRTRGPGRSPPE